MFLTMFFSDPELSIIELKYRIRVSFLDQYHGYFGIRLKIAAISNWPVSNMAAVDGGS